MLSGDTPSACAMVGTAVFKIVVSSASMKKATATSHGDRRLPEGSGNARLGDATMHEGKEFGLVCRSSGTRVGSPGHGLCACIRRIRPRQPVVPHSRIRQPGQISPATILIVRARIPVA